MAKIRNRIGIEFFLIGSELELKNFIWNWNWPNGLDESDHTGHWILTYCILKSNMAGISRSRLDLLDSSLSLYGSKVGLFFWIKKSYIPSLKEYR